MDWIRRTYGVPAKRGGRVRYTGDKAEGQEGTILSAAGLYLRIRLDGERHPGLYHPAWAIEYLPSQAAATAEEG